jgi:hypothetical protein
MQLNCVALWIDCSASDTRKTIEIFLFTGRFLSNLKDKDVALRHARHKHVRDCARVLIADGSCARFNRDVVRILRQSNVIAIVTMLPLAVFTALLLVGLILVQPLLTAGGAVLGIAALACIMSACLVIAFWINKRVLASPTIMPAGDRLAAADALLSSRVDFGENTPASWDRQIAVCEATLASRPETRVTHWMNAREDLHAALVPAYLRRYLWSGVYADVDRAARIALDSLALHGANDVLRAIDNLHLSLCYRESYWCNGQLAQLDAAIDERKLAAHALAQHLPARFEDDLALVELYRWRYEETGEEADLAEMRRRVLTAGAALEASELNDDAQKRLYTRALCAGMRAEFDGRQPQLDQALHLLTASLAMFESDMVRHVATLRALTRCRVGKFNETGDPEWLLRALTDLDPALAALPSTSPLLPQLLREQGDVLIALWRVGGHAPTLQHAINSLQSALSLLPHACVMRPDYVRALEEARAAGAAQPIVTLQNSRPHAGIPSRVESL